MNCQAGCTLLYIILIINLCSSNQTIPGQTIPDQTTSDQTISDQTTSESLTILPLGHPSDDFVFIKYKQTVRIDGQTQHFQQFPSGVQKLLSRKGIHSFHAALSQGTWRTKSWGPIPSGEYIDHGGLITAVVDIPNWSDE